MSILNIKRGKISPTLLAGPFFIVLVVFFIIPVLLLFSQGFYNEDKFTLGGFYAFFMHQRAVLTKTLFTGLIVTVVTGILAYPVAYSIVRSARFQGLLITLVISPILVSTVIQSFGWMVLLGRAGIINALLLSVGLVSEPIPLLYSYNGIIIGLVQILLPFMILSLAAALANIDPTLIEAAQNLGANRVRTFLTIVLPLSLPGVLAGSTIVLTASISVFVVPSLLGGAERVLSTLLAENVLYFSDWTTASTTGLIMITASFTIVYVFTVLLTRTKYRGVFQ